ncbi:thyrotropin-releasing hormone receptor-like [Liolophura sinensis]|uniref:thyrotropin-releasing hormone receptor-like n=1 Tax=Liolophura sinensis TaxID=3198878 RepID=UPI003159629A
MHIMYEFMLPVVTGLGILGNCVSILAFRQPGLRKSSTSVYLIAMLVSDTGFLITLIWPYLEAKGINLTKQPGWCHVIVYLSYVSAFLSVWFVVCITVESYIIICHPTQMKALCTVKRAKVVVVILTSGSLVGYSATAILTTSGERTCRNHHNYEAVWRAITYCDTIITLLVPYIVLTVLLTCITSKVLRRLHRRISHKRHKGTHSGAQINERACTDELPNERTNRRRRKLKVPQVRVAKMLFILSTTVFYYECAKPRDSPEPHRSEHAGGYIDNLYHKTFCK